jgi:hypothetical protein
MRVVKTVVVVKIVVNDESGVAKIVMIVENVEAMI